MKEYYALYENENPIGVVTKTLMYELIDLFDLSQYKIVPILSEQVLQIKSDISKLPSVNKKTFVDFI